MNDLGRPVGRLDSLAHVLAADLAVLGDAVGVVDDDQVVPADGHVSHIVSGSGLLLHQGVEVVAVAGGDLRNSFP